ncbi:MAG: restriction endonuclease subunit S [Candidatus Sericytochromatia bacterium]|nr:restriction endonuclease subunit S [Candidatus Sericytochromatia bacterium]
MERSLSLRSTKLPPYPFGLAGCSSSFVLPQGWAWVRLANLVEQSEAGWSPSCESHPRKQGEWGVLKVSAVSWGEFRPQENKALPSNLEPRTQYEVQSGDFLVSRANTAELVAKSVLVEDTPSQLMLSDKIVRLKLFHSIVGKFINMVNLSPESRCYYVRVAGGTSSSMKNVSREQILNLLIPLPPLAEQERIVAKVDQLLALCDQLTERTVLGAAENTQLLRALIHT